MKIDFISCSKILYFAERLSQESHYPLPESGTIVSKTDLTEKEIREIYNRLEHDGVVHEDDIAAEIEDDYGNLQHEISFDGLTVDEDKLAQYINDLKEKYGLLSAPSLPREAIVVIADQIQKVLDKKKIIKAICSIDVRGYDYVASEFEEGRYSLADILFRHAYASSRIKPLSFVLATFLNPLYYGIDEGDVPLKLFHYIDGIFSKTKNHADYKAWIEEAGKYVKTSKDEIERPEGNAISKVTHQFPFKLIAGTRWKSIIIQFFNPDRVLISVGKHRHETNYADMGFSDGRNSKPNQQWVFLRTLARIGGEITWKDSEAQKKYKKTKELLSESLRTYFPIDDDPFFPYHSGEYGKESRSYKIRITLLPDKELPERLLRGSKKKDKTLDEELADLIGTATE